MRSREYLDQLSANGRYHFSCEEAASDLGISKLSFRKRSRHLKHQGLIAEPAYNFFVIVPSEYRHVGCLPPEQFIPQLMFRDQEPYYFCLLSAAMQHGSSHQKPQYSQVMVRQRRASIICGSVVVDFVVRKNLMKMPCYETKTPRGSVMFSTPEVTALELVGYPDRSGGLNFVATVLAELAEEIDPEKLVDPARNSPLSWSQRLGYLLEFLGHEALTDPLHRFVTEKPRSYTRLYRGSPVKDSDKSFRWKLHINHKLEPDEL